MKRDKNDQIKQKNNIFEKHIIENLKKYYNLINLNLSFKYYKKLLFYLSNNIVVGKVDYI